MSRRRRAVLMGVCLVGTALLIGFDRGLLARRNARRATTNLRAASGDWARYHGKTFRVAHVVDGDTVDIEVPYRGETTTRIRLLGIDAPETRGNGDAPAFFATEASAYTRELVEGRDVTVYLDEDGNSRGKYGRLLAYIELADGRFLNEVLISEGYVYADLRFRHSYYQRYRQLESSARALGQGLWKEVTHAQWPAWRQRMRGN